MSRKVLAKELGMKGNGRFMSNELLERSEMMDNSKNRYDRVNVSLHLIILKY
jgi:hypothetical protein